MAWRHTEPFEGHHGYRSLTLDDVVYSGRHGVSVYQGATAELLWRSLPAERLSCQFINIRDLICAVTEEGRLHVLAAGTGEIIEVHEFKNKPVSIEALDEQRIVVATENTLHCLEIS